MKLVEIIDAISAVLLFFVAIGTCVLIGMAIVGPDVLIRWSGYVFGGVVFVVGIIVLCLFGIVAAEDDE